MNYGQIYYTDVANGTGCRTSLFVSGCTHHCRDCFNEMTWDFNYGEPYTGAVEDKIIESLKPAYISGLTLLGGEPMELMNQGTVCKLLQRVRSEVPHATVWIYSGYTFEELTDKSNRRCNGEHTMEILGMTDILVDGEFDYRKKDLRLRFRGSANQRIIDIPRTLKTGGIVLSELNN